MAIPMARLANAPESFRLVNLRFMEFRQRRDFSNASMSIQSFPPPGCFEWEDRMPMSQCDGTGTDDPLASWNSGPTKKSIVDFVARVTKAGGIDYVAPEQRIATFDNDGTLWSEQPYYFQLAFALDRVKAMAPQHPEWKNKQPFKALLQGDKQALATAGKDGLLQIVAATHAGMTIDDFTKAVIEWTK